MTKQKILFPLIKIHGGKWYLKNWIISHFPVDYVNRNYYEPFIGGGSVFLNKARSIQESINDLDKSIYAVWRCTARSSLFFDRLKHTFYDRNTFNYSKNRKNFYSIIDRAKCKFILHRMSRGGLGEHFGESTRLRGGIPEYENSWKNALEQLTPIHKRLMGVTITNKDAYYIITSTQEDSNSLLYIDPPYVHSTRISKSCYDNEMSDKDHQILLYECLQHQGKIIISGYDSPLYNKFLSQWNRYDKTVANSSCQLKSKSKRTEIIWKNF